MRISAKSLAFSLALAMPMVSALAAATTSHVAIVPNQDGKTDASANNSMQLLLDISSYFAP